MTNKNNNGFDMILILSIIIIIVIILFMITGCVSGKGKNESVSGDTKVKAGNKEYYLSNRYYGIYILVDDDTCVEYITRINSGIAPRYNSDGTLKLSEGCLNE